MSRLLPHLNAIARRPVRTALIVAAVGGLGSIALPLGDLIQPAIEQMASRVARRAASGDIVIVELDARSLDQVDSWPWPRSTYATLTDRLRVAGAERIAFDVDLSSPSYPKEDGLFAAALERFAGRVILPALTQTAGSGSSEWVDALPLPIFRTHTMLAAVNVRPDIDGQVSAMPLAMTVAGMARPSLPAMLADQSGSSADDVPIDFAIDPDTLPRISAVDVISGRFVPDQVRGKTVMIGATAIQLGDRYAVPGYGVTPGVVIQALAAETLSSQRPAMRVPAWLVLLLALPILALALRQPIRRAVSGLVTVAILILLAPVGLRFVGQIALEVTAALAATLVAAATVIALAEVRRRRVVSLTDLVTGRPNRAAFLSALGGPVHWVVTARIVNLTAITGVVGEVASLRLLDQVMDRLQVSALGQLCYRLGGDRLALMGVEADEERLVGTLHVLAQLMRTPVVVDGRALDVQVAFGYATAAGEPSARLAAAELALDKAVATRAIAVGAHGDELTDGTDWSLSLLGELDQAIVNGQVWVAFQAKHDFATNRIIGSEALVRWQHPTRGAIRPDDFIPLAEANNRLGELTAAVLDQAVAGTAMLRARGADLSVAVNISTDLLIDGTLVAVVRDTLTRHGLPGGKLTLEITESQVIARMDAARRCLAELRTLGVRLSIDDYGTGQSTLTYLRDLAADELKIDQSFVRDLTDRANTTLVRSTIQLAHDMGMTVVAEGIEDDATLRQLGEWGCDIGQGYGIARPVPLADFETLVMKQQALAG